MTHFTDAGEKSPEEREKILQQRGMTVLLFLSVRRNSSRTYRTAA